tara:strand:- start:3144 stop:3269 length:126 start_codon:yes stop_codon:yes gene_type:complete
MWRDSPSYVERFPVNVERFPVKSTEQKGKRRTLTTLLINLI